MEVVYIVVAVRIAVAIMARINNAIGSPNLPSFTAEKSLLTSMGKSKVVLVDSREKVIPKVNRPAFLFNSELIVMVLGCSLLCSDQAVSLLVSVVLTM